MAQGSHRFTELLKQCNSIAKKKLKKRSRSDFGFKVSRNSLPKLSGSLCRIEDASEESLVTRSVAFRSVHGHLGRPEWVSLSVKEIFERSSKDLRKIFSSKGTSSDEAAAVSTPTLYARSKKLEPLCVRSWRRAPKWRFQALKPLIPSTLHRSCSVLLCPGSACHRSSA